MKNTFEIPPKITFKDIRKTYYTQGWKITIYAEGT